MCLIVDVTKEQEKAINEYAKLKNLSVSELLKRAVLQQMEDDEDLKNGLEALEEYNKNPISYSHKEVFEMLGLENV